MGNRAFPFTMGARVNDRESIRLDAVCLLKGLTRADYLRLVVLPQVERDLRAELEGDAA